LTTGPTPEVADLAAGVRAGDRRALARAITLVESTRADHRRAALSLVEILTPDAGRSLRIGITGVPGVGKSTFIETFGNRLIDFGERIAVLTVDPSSAISGGSILGDKTRMETLSRRREAFIRPSPAGTMLGGVARHTRETILLVEAAGYTHVIVETVGVGQSEVSVADMSDLFVLLLAPAGGDELQGLKRGIVELADVLVVNKADGELEAAARRTAGDYANALQLLRPRSSDWTVPVLTCSALEGTGIDAVWDAIGRFRDAMRASGAFTERRARQALAWMWAEATAALTDRLRESAPVRARVSDLEAAVRAGALAPSVAAQTLVDAFLSGPGLWNIDTRA
jgi:LAO/AO transport system kinase